MPIRRFKISYVHCVKRVRIWSYSGPHFSHISRNSTEYGEIRITLNAGECEENADQNNSEYGLLLRSGENAKD